MAGGGNFCGAIGVSSNKINWAIEIHTAVSVTDHDYAIDNGIIRIVTGRPHYDGHTVVPTYGRDEIDAIGTVISGTTNTHIYFQDFITKDGIDGNAMRSIDITSSGSYGNDATFSFKLRGDKIAGDFFWKFLEENGIVLTNSIVNGNSCIEFLSFSLIHRAD